VTSAEVRLLREALRPVRSLDFGSPSAWECEPWPAQCSESTVPTLPTVVDTVRSQRSDEGRWSVNESLLQSYRAIFISSQSFLLAVGTIVVQSNVAVVSIVASVGLVMIWWIWFPVVRSRHRIVDYYKFRIGEIASDCAEHDYVHDGAKNRAAHEAVGLRSNWRETRIKIDAVIPALFSLIWVTLLVYAATTRW
jgi:hypothetical protein